MKAWLYAGAGLAVAVGLVLGVAMRPRLAGPDEPAASQAPAQTPAAALTAPAPTAQAAEEAAIARYGDKLPDYVLGTDLHKLSASAAGPSTPIMPDPQNYYVSPLGHPQAADAAAVGEAVDASALATADGEVLPPPLPVVGNSEVIPEAAGDTTRATP